MPTKCAEEEEEDHAVATRHVDYGARHERQLEVSSTHAEDGGEEKEKSDKLFKSRRDVLVFLCLALNNLIASICFATMAPFFPSVAFTKSPDYVAPVSPTVGSTATPVSSSPTTSTTTLVGLVFSMATFSDFISSPLVGMDLPRVGPKLVFILGCSLVAGVTILFGFVDMVDDWTTFLALCYSLRVVQGLGTACMFTASFTILAGAFPQSVGTVTGTLEVFSGVGFMLGPAIGGSLFSTGGFKLPFLVTGSMMAVSASLMALVLPAAEHKKEERLSMLTILKQPRAWLLIPTTVLSASSLGFLDPSLGPFLKQSFHLSPSKIGLVFLIGAGMYAVLAPVVGYVGDKFSTRPLIPAGLLLSGCAYQLLGPSPLFRLHAAAWRTFTGLALMGMGIAVTLVPSATDLLVTMREAGHKDSLALHSAIGGILGASFSLGEGAGPAVGGLMDGALGFAGAASIFGVMLLAQFVIVTLGTSLGYVRAKARKSNAKPLDIQDDGADDEDLSENSRLLPPSGPPKISTRLTRRSISHTRLPSLDGESMLPTPTSESAGGSGSSSKA